MNFRKPRTNEEPISIIDPSCDIQISRTFEGITIYTACISSAAAKQQYPVHFTGFRFRAPLFPAFGCVYKPAPLRIRAVKRMPTPTSKHKISTSKQAYPSLAGPAAGNQPHEGGARKPANKKKAGPLFRIRLEEAATYSPTRVAQYHRR